MDHVEQHGQHIDLEETANHALQLQAHHARPQRSRFLGKLVAGELVVPLDWAGNKGGKVERVENVGANAHVLLPGVVSRFDQQVKNAKEDVREPQSEVRRVEEDGIGQEGVLL